LLPGLTDGHIHFFQSGGLYTRPDGLDFRKYHSYEKEIEWTHLNMKDVLKRYIMNGITSVIDVGATNNFLRLRDKFKGKSFAPSVYITGPLLTTDEPDVYKKLGNDEPFSLVTTEKEGTKMVQQQLPYHPDFIKIWYILEQGKDKEQSARKYLPIIKAIIDEAHKNKLKVAVHATERITAQLAVENGCDYLVHSVDDEIITDAFAKLLKEKNITFCPTLTIYGNTGKVYGQQLNFSDYELKNANPEQINSLDDLKHLPEQGLINSYKNSVRAGKAIYDTQDSICLANLKKLADAGVRIIAGTDAGNPGTLHGTSLLSELQAMKKSGISNWQVLQSATINPAYFFNKQKESGSITPGKIADLVLLKANPVADLQNLQQISLVINKGHVIKPDTLIRETPLALVQRQLNAYNARNIEAFLEPYADDVELYQFPDKLLSKGKEAMRKDYAFFNEVPDLHCEIKERIIQGNIIIDKESVLGFGSKPAEATAIYHIEGNKIKKVYFIQ
jgi:imidazolonepropionase-like amidohydrolase